MASKKTEATELALAFGLLGIQNPTRISPDERRKLFEGTLQANVFTYFLDSFSGQYHDICQVMLNVGLRIRNNHSHIKNYNSLRLMGKEQIYITTSLSKDIQIGPLAISSKASSNVVVNLSPYNLLIALPSGKVPATRSLNWYIIAAKGPFQNYYDKWRKLCFPNQPEDIETFFNQTTQKERKKLVKRKKNLSQREITVLEKTYEDFCHQVAEASAECFRSNLNNSLKSRSSQAVMIQIAKTFFRMDSSPYILAGQDHNKPIALEIPDINTWRRNWEISEIITFPDLEAGQPKVYFRVNLVDRQTTSIHPFNFHTEIRWSHGKLCGNPEGKLYKDFAWKDLPFVENIFD
ncbi:MAG: hypothetical protein ACTSRS_21535 [Candidatus Helarchaeota archaeon]